MAPFAGFLDRAARLAARLDRRSARRHAGVQRGPRRQGRARGASHFGSAGHKVSRLLAGEADVYAHTVGLREWDTCAPETVARALGWHVSKLRGEEHVYNQKNPKNHELLVCRPAWKERLLVALKDSGALEPAPERVRK